MSVTRIALVGIGKIARDQHIPTIAASEQFELVAAVTGHEPPEGTPGFRTIAEMMRAMPEVQAVSICTPPRRRIQLVAEAFDHGLDVMIEKPPAATISEAEAFAELARAADCHWKEDVRVWHPGQAWIWEPGIGVFDPGINALSVLTRILPAPLLLQAAALRFPENRDAPIAADLDYRHDGAPVRVEFDFDQRGPQTWDIHVETDGGTLTLSLGASKLAIDGEPVDVGEVPEYAGLYRRFAELRARRESDVDLSPFHHVADAFLLGRRETTIPFEE